MLCPLLLLDSAVLLFDSAALLSSRKQKTLFTQNSLPHAILLSLHPSITTHSTSSKHSPLGPAPASLLPYGPLPAFQEIPTVLRYYIIQDLIYLMSTTFSAVTCVNIFQWFVHKKLVCMQRKIDQRPLNIFRWELLSMKIDLPYVE